VVGHLGEGVAARHLHALHRRTSRTLMSQLGVESDIAELAIGHEARRIAINIAKMPAVLDSLLTNVVALTERAPFHFRL